MAKANSTQQFQGPDVHLIDLLTEKAAQLDALLQTIRTSDGNIDLNEETRGNLWWLATRLSSDVLATSRAIATAPAYSGVMP